MNTDHLEVERRSYLPERIINNKVARPPNSLELVLKHCLMRDLSQNTIISFKADIKKFLVWFLNVNGEEFTFKRSTLNDLLEYKEFLKHNHKPATVNRNISSLKILFKTAYQLEEIDVDYSVKLKSVSRTPLAPKALNELGARRFMREIEIRNNPRDRMIAGLMLFSGLRCSEVVNLFHSDISISERSGWVEIRNSKGEKSRTVPLPAKLRNIISDFYRSLDYEPVSSERIFKTARGNLTKIAVSKMIDRYAQKAGVKCNPHKLRHTFAYSFLKYNQKDIVALSQILGHESVLTTSAYTQNTIDDLAFKMERGVESVKAISFQEIR